MEFEPLARWRLMLGEAAQDTCGRCQQESALQACDAALAWLYDRQPEGSERDLRRCGGREAPTLDVPEWINQIHQLFPQETIERLERDAVERYQIEEVVTRPEVLRRVQPSQAMLEAVLRTRHLMNQEVLSLARDLVRQVVELLIKKLAREVERSFNQGQRMRRSSPFKFSRELDFGKTIRANLKHYDPESRQLVLQKPYFYQRQRRQRVEWQLILLVDQSGSMLPSVIHSAVTAACLWGIPTLRTHLLVFSTEVVDLTPEVVDPVELLMRVQLGGGTDIGKAVRFAADLIHQPRRSVVVIVSDFYEGGNPLTLVREVGALVAQGTRVLGLAALDPEANPAFDRDMGQQLQQVGAEVGAMTPAHLVDWLADVIR